MCVKVLERKLQHLREEEAQAIMDVAFRAYMRPLETVKAFKYFGRVLIASYYDWLAVFDILRKAWSRWEYRSRILGKEGADPKTSRTFYKAVVQATLLFGSYIWVMTPVLG